MKHKIKIVMSYEEEDLDSDGRPLNLPTLYLDGYAIGGVQRISFQASSKEVIPHLEIVFPNLHDENIDPTYYINTNTHYPLSRDLDCHIYELSQVPGIKITLQNIDDGVSNVIPLGEIGTNGLIELVPMKRRH